MTLSKHYTNLALVLVLASATLLSACGTMTPPQTLQIPATTKTYLIGPGDQLRIFVRDNSELSVSIPVRPDGKISIPLVKSIQAAGKTPVELAQDLENALSQYIRNPHVSVMVTSFVGTYENRIRIIGEAVRPQALPYRKGMTLLDVMIAVGGLTPFAAGNRATLVRTVNGKTKTYDIDLAALLNGELSVNVPVRPGDVITIPRALF